MLMKKQFQSKSVPRGTRTIWRYLGALFILFTFAIGNVWAADVAYSTELGGTTTGNESVKIHTDTDSQTAIAKFVNSCISNGVLTNYWKISGTFKAGDVISFTGVYNNSKTKETAIAIYTSDKTQLFKSAACINGRTSAADPEVQSYTLLNDYDELYIGRDGSTATFLLTFSITREGGSDPTPSTPTTPALTYNAGAYIVGGTALDLSTLINTKQSNGAITYSVKTDGGTSATISGNNFSATTAGTCVVTASQAADGDTYLATSAEFNVVVSAAPAEKDGIKMVENGALTGNFRIKSSQFKSGSYTVEGIDYTKYVQLSSTSSSLGGETEGAQTKGIYYAPQKKNVKFWFYMRNTDSSAKTINIVIMEEGKSASSKSVSVPVGSQLVSYDLAIDKNAEVVFMVNSTKLYYCQIVAVESGDALLQGGEVGYVFDYAGKRQNIAANTIRTIDGIDYMLSAESKINSGSNVQLTTLGTHYIKFHLNARTKVSIECDNKPYKIGTSKSGETAQIYSGQDDGAFNLAAGDWYINGAGETVKITKLSFLEPDAAYAVTYAAGSFNETAATVKTGKELPTHADAIAGEKITLASGENLQCAGADFAGWKANGTGDLLEAGADYTMTAAAVQFVAQWTAHIAKYGVKFMDGATKLDSLSVTLGEAPVFANPTKALYSFAGWKDGEDNDVTMSDLATSVTVEDTKLVLYAQWNKVYAADGTVNFADDNNSGALADFLPAGYACGNLDGSKNSVWGKESEGDAYFGYKLRHSGAYVELRVVANKRVTFTFGNYAQAGTIKVGEAAAETCTLTDSKYVVDTDAEAVIRFTTTSDGTVTLKSIIIGEIPALSDDATLSDLTLKYGTAAATTISDFASTKQIYYVEAPYGTAKADLPIVGATATDATNALVTINQAKDREDWKTVIRVQAEDRIEAHDMYYEVRFTVAPKYGVELIKATHNGTENGATVTGYIGGTVDKLTQTNGKLGSGAQSGDDPHHYFGIQLAEGTFKAGDMLVIKASALNGGNAATLYSDKGNTEIKIDGQFDTNSKMYVYTLEDDVEKIYLYRQTSGCNPNVEYMAVYRLMAPFIEEFKIGEAVGTITGTNIAVEVPYAADLEHLTPAVKYWANGTAQISPAIGVTDFSDPVVFTVSSGYAEDATGAYAPVPYTVTVTKEAHYEAKIGETGYATLVAAVEAAQDGDVIVLQEDVTNGAGVMLTKTDAKEITIDFGGYTYTAVSPAVGSAGTQNQAFHLEKGNTVTLKNGTITSSGSEIKMLIQNYCDLTLENITLDGSGLEGSHRYVMSNNCGDVVIGDGTTITAKDGDVAFDVCATNYYPEGVTVTVKDGATISGIVEYDVWGTKPADNHAELAIEGGNFDVTWNVEAALAEDAKDNLNVSGGTFTAAVPADYCAEGYAPTSWTVGTETKYGVHLLGVIRGAASTNSDGVYYYTLDNDVTIFSSESDGRLKTSTHIATSSDVVACGGDNGGYNVNKGSFVLQFPVNVKEFTIYGANSTERTISKVYVNATASTEIKIKNVGRELTGTYTNTKDEKCQTLTAVFAGENIISANDYVLINLSGSVNMYRILYTEAECTDPVITAVNNTIGTVGESATVSVEATALGATYQWYTCDENGDNAEIIGTATAASYTFTKGAGVEYFKVVVGNNCNTATVSAVAKAEVWAPTTTLVDVTENTTWDWTLVTSRADGSAIDDSDGNGPKLNTTNGMIIGNYILGNNFDKVEGNNGAYAIRKAANKYYQGASLHMHTTVSGYLSIWAANEGHSMTLNLVNDGRDMQIAQLTGSQVEYKVYVKAGDVVIYNIPASSTYPMRVSKMIFTVDETPDYTRTVSNNIGTLCVDHNVVAGGALGATFYQIASRNELYNDKIDFEEVLPNEELKAGEPYIFKSTTGKIELFYGATVADAPVAVRGMIGSFANTTLDITEENKSDILYIAQNKLWNCEDLVASDLEVVANRAYIVMSDVPTYAEYQAAQTSNPAPRRRVTLGRNAEQVATGIEDVQGDKVQCTKMLINGQLFILRGEKMYDAKGQLVK